MSNDIYKYPLLEMRKIRDMRDMLNQSEELFSEKSAFLVKDPVALRECEARSEQAKNYKPNVEDEYRAISYKQFITDVRAFGSALKNLRINHSNKVCILAETRYEWYVSYLAVVNGLATVVPLDKNLSTNELLNNLQRAEANTIIYSGTMRNIVKELDGQVDFVENYINMNIPEGELHGEENLINGKKEIFFWDVLEDGLKIREKGDLSYDSLEIDPYEFSILLFTSGTTAKSKAVMLSHNNICNCAYNSSQMIDFEDTTILSILPLHHTYEATCGFIIQIYMGNTIAIGDGLRHITKNAQQAKSTMILMVPAILEAIYRTMNRKLETDEDAQKKFNLGLKLSSFLKKIGIDIRKKIFKQVHDMFGGKMRYFIVGGAAIEPKVLEFFSKLGFSAIQGYGLTEASPIFALNREFYNDPRSAGLPIPSMEVKIINQDKNGIGEIVGRGPSIMLGYYEDPERTAEAIDKDGFYHTGDYGYMDERSFVYITGRKANIIVGKGGENVFPEEIEFILEAYPIVKEVVVFGRRDDSGEQIISAEIFPDKEYIEEKLETKTLTDEKVHQEIRNVIKSANLQLKQHQKIMDYEIREEAFVKNTSNKIIRNRNQVNV